ncbi:MAG: GNAT family N-acetyltransferase [Desulfofustis sp.]|nr:GNAT family N-acetyltransferase [Desulfofustis sp.]
MQYKKIRRALPEEAARLTELSFASKAYWQYPQSYYRRWQQELTITADFIDTHNVYVCDDGSSPCGFYSLVILHEALHVSGLVLAAGVCLEHMFVHPDNIGQGVGTILFNHMCQLVEEGGNSLIHLLADPHALLFYEKMGCVYQGECSSTIPGRTTPYLICNLDSPS